MMLWFVFALMTAAAMFAALLPLGLGGGKRAGGNEAAVYKDQLAEVDSDLQAGLIGTAEAEAARVEIGRRLLAATDQDRDAADGANVRLRRAAAVIALVGLPIVAVATYLPLGSPRLGDFPLAERAREEPAKRPLDQLVAQVEQHLEKNPTDGRGWTVLAPVLARLGRFDDSVQAFRNAITYDGETAERRADLGEVMAASAGGVVTAEAKGEFERALALDADEVKASYFLGLAAEQDGRKSDAAGIWRAMLAKAPVDAPWRPLVTAALTRVTGEPPAAAAGEPNAPTLSPETMAAAKDMKAGDREAMIRGMVERLATRLKQNGDDVEGWLRLVRAYLVMGDQDKAKSALSDARQAVSGDAERLKQLNDGLKNLGVDGVASEPRAPALSPETMAAAKDMNAPDREAMIKSMVERLATRLKQNGDDVEGWLRLVRAYLVMGDQDKAKNASSDARQAVSGDAARLKQLNDGLKNLGLDG